MANWIESKKLGYVEKLPIDIESNFIHLCEEQQITKIISKFWSQEQQIVILMLDPEKLIGRLIKEKNSDGNTEYFHLYDGSIPLEAVVAVKIKTNAIIKNILKP